MAPRDGGGAARNHMYRDIPYLNNFPLYPTSSPPKPSLHLCFPLLPALTNSFRKHFTHSRNPSSASSTSVRSPGHLSLHDYRKYLSSSDTDPPNTSRPQKTLKRKARASNLNPTSSQPSSPYSSSASTPSTASSSSSSLSSSTTSTSTSSSPRRIVRRKPRTSNLNLARARFDPSIPFSSLSSPTTPPSSFLFAPSLQSPFQEPDRRETANCSEDTVLSSSQQSGQVATRLNPHNIQLNPYQYRTLQIQNFLSLSPDSSLDSALILDPGSSQVTLRHCDVSFEIINPHKSLCRSQILSPEESKTNSLVYREMSFNSNTMETNSGAEKRPGPQAEGQQRRPTIPHSMFDDLQTHPHQLTEGQDADPSSLSSSDSRPTRSLQPEDAQPRPTISHSVFDGLPNNSHEAVNRHDPDLTSQSSGHNSADTAQPDGTHLRPSLSYPVLEELPDSLQGNAEQQAQVSPLIDRPHRTLVPEDQQRRPSVPTSIFEELSTNNPETEHRQHRSPLPRSIFDDLPPSLRSEDQLRRPTPPRALFEDLPTAYTSITSRTPPCQQGKSLASSPCADLPRTQNSTRSGPLAGQTGEVPYSIPFSSLKDGVPPVMVGPGHEVPTVTSPGVQSSSSSKEMARTLTRRVSKLLSMNGLSNRKSSVVLPTISRLERKPSSRPNKLVKHRPLSTLAHNKNTRDIQAPQNARSSLTQEVNWNQPNFHSARGRVDKHNKIDEIVRKRYSGGTGSKRNSLRQSFHNPGSRLSTDFRYVNHSEVFEHQSEVSSDKQTFVEASETPIESAAGDAPDVPLPSPPQVGTRLQDPRPNSIQSALSSDFSYGNTQNLLLLPQGSSLARVNPLSVTETIEEEPLNQDDQELERMAYTSEHEGIGIALTTPFESSQDFGDRNPYKNSVYANSIDIFGTHGSLSGEAEPPLPSIRSVYDCGNPTALAGGVQDATSSSLAAPEVDDLGPGEYQSSSSHNLSQHGNSFWNMRPRIGGLKGLKANNPFLKKYRDGNTPTIDPDTQRVSASGSVDREGGQIETNKGRVGVDDGEEDDTADWETIGAESQIFPSEPANNFGQAGTAGSLANYSSYGSFLPESRTHLNSQVDQFSRDTTPFQSGRRVPTHTRFYQESRSGRSVLPAESCFPTIEEDVSFSNQNVLAPPAPMLAATTRNEPESSSLRGSRYKHPHPLKEPHKNPFQSTPPEIPQGHKAVKRTQGYPEAGSIDSELNKYQNPEDYEESESRDQVHRTSDELVSSATAPRDITSFSSSAWITEVTSSHTGPFPSPSTFPHHTHQNNNNTAAITTTSTEHSSTRVVSGGQADNKNSESLALSSYIHYSQGQPGQTRAREPSPTPMPPSQRLAREASNLMSAAMSTSSTDRLLPATSVAKPSPGSITKSIRTARERFRASRSKGARLEEMVREEEGRASRASAGSSREPTAAPKPPPPAKTSRLVRHKTPRRDDLVRERLRRMESTVLADYLPSASSRTGSRLVSARTVGGGLPRQGSALSTVGDEEDPWFSVEEGHYVFADPPRLLPVPNRRHSEPVPTIVVQGRLGRKLVWGSFLLPVFGMGVLLCIGMGVEASNRLMTWCSGGVVEEFHNKERVLARRLCGMHAMVIMAAIIITVVFSLKL